MKIRGIDVSYCQTKVDWQKVKEEGIRFAMVRVGYCMNDGSLKVDRMFQSHMEGAAAAGLDVGMYLYSYATSPSAAQKAAQQVLKAVEPYKLTYPIALDMEYDEEYIKNSKENNTAIAAAFLREMEKGGYYAMLYCSKDFLDSYLLPERLTAFDKWIAQYNSKCTSKHAHGIWQYSGSGKVRGVAEKVDLDVAYKDYPRIIRRAKLNKLEE